jgi:uncharacterized Zn-binding protein involved in type VI secretion
MGEPSAKQGDQITAKDTHVLMVPSPGGPVPTPTQMPFAGLLSGNLSPNVKIEGRAAATVGSTASNQPPHVAPPTSPFQVLPSNQGSIRTGSSSVFINGKPAARAGDSAQTCSDPNPNLNAKVVAPPGTIYIGG